MVAEPHMLGQLLRWCPSPSVPVQLEMAGAHPALLQTADMLPAPTNDQHEAGVAEQSSRVVLPAAAVYVAHRHSAWLLPDARVA